MQHTYFNPFVLLYVCAAPFIQGRLRGSQFKKELLTVGLYRLIVHGLAMCAPIRSVNAEIESSNTLMLIRTFATLSSSIQGKPIFKISFNIPKKIAFLSRCCAYFFFTWKPTLKEISNKLNLKINIDVFWSLVKYR